MKKFQVLLYIIICTSLIFFSETSTAQKNEHRPLDIVICVDLSGSTNGLINNVRDNLWLIINQANIMIPIPDLRIAVVGFSRPSFGKNTGYVKVLCDLTYNFDHLETELFKLKPSIEKGDQYVSAALSTCISQISWSKQIDAKKIIFLCGNGMVTSNGFDYIKYCEQANEKNIIVNTLYIPNGANIMRELPAWRRIATITKGMQSEITVANKDDVTVFSDAKIDRVREINNKLNATYLWSGMDSSFCRRSLVTADSGAYYTRKEAFFNRVYFKTTTRYEQLLKDCELVNAYTIGSITATTDSSQTQSTFAIETREHFNDMKIAREKLHIALRVELPEQEVNDYKNRYASGEMPENNIFQRVILTMLFKEWEGK